MMSFWKRTKKQTLQGRQNGQNGGVADLPGSRFSVPLQTPSIGLPLSILPLPSTSLSTSSSSSSSSSTSTSTDSTTSSNTISESTASSTSISTSTSVNTPTSASASSTASSMSTLVSVTFHQVSPDITACSSQVLVWDYSGPPNATLSLDLIATPSESPNGPSPASVGQPGSDIRSIYETLTSSISVSQRQFVWTVAVPQGQYQVQAYDSTSEEAGISNQFNVVLGNDVSCLSSSSSTALSSSTSTIFKTTSKPTSSMNNSNLSPTSSSSTSMGAGSGSMLDASSHKISGGGIAGIVIAVIVGIIALVLLVLFFLRRRLFSSSRRDALSPSNGSRRGLKEKPEWAGLGSNNTTQSNLNSHHPFQFGGISSGNMFSTNASSAGAVEDLMAGTAPQTPRDPRDPFATPAPSRAGSHHAGSPTGSFAQHSEDDLSPTSSTLHHDSPLAAASVLDRGAMNQGPYMFGNQGVHVGSAIGAGALGVAAMERSRKRRSTSTTASVNDVAASSPTSQHTHTHSNSSVNATSLNSSSSLGAVGVARRATLRKPVPMYNESHELTTHISQGASSSAASLPPSGVNEIPPMPTSPTQAHLDGSMQSRRSGDSSRSAGRNVPPQFAHVLEHKPSFGEKPMTHVLIPDMPPQ